MPRAFWVGAALLLALMLAPAPRLHAQGEQPDWSDAKATKVADGLAFPADFAFAPDGSIWFTEKMASNITRLDPRTGATTVMWHAPDAVEARDERGMLGLAFDPDAGPKGPYYVYYTQRNGDPERGVNRLVRLQGSDVQAVLLDGISAYQEHNGGKVVFAPDGPMFVSVGENSKSEPAQDPDSLLGKILRITREGEPVEGNLRGLVYSLGHRNPYGLAYDPATRTLYETENSGWQRDEVNLVEAGKNYGYPLCEGFSKYNSEDPCPERFAPPLGEFTHTSTVAPVGMAVFRGEVYWASWNKGDIHRIAPPPEGRDARPWVDKVVFRTRPYERLIDLEPGPDGRSVYFSTMDAIWRIEFEDLRAEPPTPGDPPEPPDEGEPPPARTPAAADVQVERGTPAPGLAMAAAGIALAAWLARRRS